MYSNHFLIAQNSINNIYVPVIIYDMFTITVFVFYLIVFLYEGELPRLQELSLGDIQPVFTVQELDHRPIAVPHRQIVLHYQTLQMLYDTSAETR